VYTCNIYSQMLTSLWCQHKQKMKYIINECLHSYLRTNYIALVITSHYLSLNCNLSIIGMNNNVMQLEFNIEKKWDCINIESLLLHLVLKIKENKKQMWKDNFFMSHLKMGQTNSSLELSKGQLMKPTIILFKLMTMIFLQLINQWYK
jgi:hypothetical protein